MLMLHPTRAARIDGSKTVVLRVTHERKRQYLSMGLSCAPESWDSKKHQLKKSYNPENFKDLNYGLSLKKSKARKIIFDLESSGKPFNIDLLKEKLAVKKEKMNVSEFFEKRIKELPDLGKIGNASVYRTSKNALSKFPISKDIRFQDLTDQILVSYEAFLRKSGCSNNTIFNYMRTLRALYNSAISQGIADRDLYPFYNNYTRSGYQMGKLKTATQKRAITMDDLKKISEYKAKELSAEHDAKLFFLFSYYAWGINFTDMANLRWGKNIQGDVLVYTRAKTRHTKTFRIPIKPQLKAILDYFKNYSTGEL